MDLVDRISAYEEGRLSSEETTALFQDLINSGLVWELQGSYTRMAHYLLRAGLCTLPATSPPT
jgi:hypothetical protein